MSDRKPPAAGIRVSYRTLASIAGALLGPHLAAAIIWEWPPQLFTAHVLLVLLLVLAATRTHSDTPELTATLTAELDDELRRLRDDTPPSPR